MKIIVIYNRDSSGDPEVEDSVATAKEIAKSLATLGHQTQLFELATAQLPKLSADVLFNQAWGIGADLESEDKVAQILEKTGLAYTGPDAKTIRVTSNKAKTKKLLQRTGLPTPKWQVIDRIKPPFIVKPTQENCSIGISQKSIYQETVMAEQFIDGRELNVTILGNQVLPISEIVFGPFFADKHKIVDYAAKWETKSKYYQQTVGVCPAKLTRQQQERVEKTALRAYQVTGCRDFARVDIRLSGDNVPYLLEVNVNPSLGPEDGATRSARAAGYSYPKFLEKIVKLAYERRHEAAGP